MTESGQTEYLDGRSRAPDLARCGGMEVLCGFDERFVPHAATMLCSLLENNLVSRVHILHSAFVGQDSERLKSLIKKLEALIVKYECQLVCYEVRSEEFCELRVDETSSVANYFRLLAPRVLPAHVMKILYLDSDVIVRGSLLDLWNCEVSGYALAAVEDSFWDPKSQWSYVEIPKGARYFNSGVMLINLDYWRQNNVGERAIAFIRDNPTKVNYYDQDALNAILVNSWISLSPIWNHHIPNPAIVHFIGEDKPWRWSTKHAYKMEYYRYRRKTPWRHYWLAEGWVVSQRTLSRSLRRFARAVLPGSLQQWLRLHLKSLGT
jgi:lipopolysaccharide biosynthesis glycosyltransferase